MPNKAMQHPNHFLDGLLRFMDLKNDAALSRLMDVTPPVISKIRHGHLPVTAGFLLKAHDTSGLSIEELRKMLYQTDDF